MRRLVLIPLLAGLARALPAASSHAATTFGSQMAGGTFGFSFNGCSGICTYVQQSAPQFTSPVSGVVVRWRVLAASSGSPVQLRLLRPAGGGFLMVGSSGQEATTGGTTDVFATRLPVRAGDALGIDSNSQARLAAQSDQSAIVGMIDPAGPDGTTAQPSSTPGDSLQGQELQASADVEPDADGDGFGDETQDCAPADASRATDCSPPDVAITAGPKDKTKKKRATFEFSGTDTRAVAGFECSLDGGAYVACGSPLTVKVKKGRHTLSVRASDDAGNVDPTPATRNWKVKRKKRRGT